MSDNQNIASDGFPLREIPMNSAVTRFGVSGDHGVFVTGSSNTNFPQSGIGSY
jgi:hypothetical protein